VPNQHHRLADPVQWMVDGFLPLDFLFAEALDDVEQLRVGVGHGHCERGGGDGDAAHRLVEERRGPKRRSYPDRSVGGRCVKPPATGRQWFPAAARIRVTKRINTKSVSWTTFGMVTG
jgi:hypothetical protein